MSAEIKQLNSTVNVTVTKPWQVPFTLTANTAKITVHPSEATVYMSGVKPSSNGYGEVVNFTYPGTLLQFNNSRIQQLPYLGIFRPSYTLISSYTAFPLPPNTKLELTYHEDTGHFIFNFPCFASVLVQPYDVKVREFLFDVDPKTNYSKGPPVAGFAWAKYRPPTVPKTAPPDVYQTASCEVPLGGIHRYERYRICIPTVVTDIGEYHRPLPGGTIPNADFGTVDKDVPIEIGYINMTGHFAIAQPYPKLLGTQVLPLVAYISDRPNYTGSKETYHSRYDDSEGWVKERIELYRGSSPFGIEVPKEKLTGGEGIWK